MSPFISQYSGMLCNLPLITDAKTRSISAENPDGRPGGGARAIPPEQDASTDLGVGWKVKPWIQLDAGKTRTIAEITGPGVIQHIWCTVAEVALRNCLLRFYWDDESEASIEVPLGDFFACGHGLRTEVNSMPVVVAPAGGMNCYWAMPFKQGARITIENQHTEDIPGFFYQVTWSEQAVPDETAYLHAQWRRSMTSREYPEHVIVDGIQGSGHYVGTYLAWTQFSNGWWGEGEVKFYLDGDREHPSICGTGTEDYVGGAWCFAGEDGREKPYSTAFLGLPLVRHVANEVPKYGMYRWHVPDPIRFQQDLRVTVQALGWWPNGRYQPLTDDIASTAYWYQQEPHSKYPPMPAVSARWPR